MELVFNLCFLGCIKIWLTLHIATSLFNRTNVLTYWRIDILTLLDITTGLDLDLSALKYCRLPDWNIIGKQIYIKPWITELHTYAFITLGARSRAVTTRCSRGIFARIFAVTPFIQWVCEFGSSEIRSEFGPEVIVASTRNRRLIRTWYPFSIGQYIAVVE